MLSILEQLDLLVGGYDGYTIRLFTLRETLKRYSFPMSAFVFTVVELVMMMHQYRGCGSYSLSVVVVI